MARVTKEDFEKRVKERFPDEEFEVLSYDSLGKPLKIQCLNCGKIIEVSQASNFLIYSKKQGCKYCKSDFVQKRQEKIEAIKEKYDILNIYQKASKEHFRYKIRCKNCGHVRESYLLNLYNHLECGCKTGVLRRTPEEFEKELKQKKNDSYELVSEYKGMATPILIRHKDCGFIWRVRPSDLMYERSADCPHCRKEMSKGAKEVYNSLKSLEIPFETEHTLDGSLLRFDFYFAIENQKCAIEFNGAQHYKFSQLFHHTEDGLQIQKERDERKREYCREHNIFLLEIPYTYSKSQIKQVVEDFVQEAQRLK